MAALFSLLVMIEFIHEDGPPNYLQVALAVFHYSADHVILPEPQHIRAHL